MTTTNNKLITFGYSTLSDRIKGIKPPTLNQDHELIVLVQNPDAASYVFNIPTAKLVELKSSGVAKSRNAAIKYASGKYLIFGDDDITFDGVGVAQIIQYFEEHPECSIILAQASDESGKLRKIYPKKKQKLTSFNSGKAATYEIMIRVDVIRSAQVLFDENFGAGVDNYLGDEYIFITDALKKGLKGTFLPIRVAIHPKDSSGSNWGTQSDLSARAAVFTRIFGFKAPIFRLLFLLKPGKTRLRFIDALRFIVGQ